VIGLYLAKDCCSKLVNRALQPSLPQTSQNQRTKLKKTDKRHKSDKSFESVWKMPNAAESLRYGMIYRRDVCGLRRLEWKTKMMTMNLLIYRNSPCTCKLTTIGNICVQSVHLTDGCAISYQILFDALLVIANGSSIVQTTNRDNTIAASNVINTARWRWPQLDDCGEFVCTGKDSYMLFLLSSCVGFLENIVDLLSWLLLLLVQSVLSLHHDGRALPTADVRWCDDCNCESK